MLMMRDNREEGRRWGKEGQDKEEKGNFAFER